MKGGDLVMPGGRTAAAFAGAILAGLMLSPGAWAQTPATETPAAASGPEQKATTASASEPQAPAAVSEPPAAPPVDPVIAYVRQKLSAPPTERGIDRKDWDALAATYAQRTEPPLWVGDGSSRPGHRRRWRRSGRPTTGASLPPHSSCRSCPPQHRPRRWVTPRSGSGSPFLPMRGMRAAVASTRPGSAATSITSRRCAIRRRSCRRSLPPIQPTPTCAACIRSTSSSSVCGRRCSRRVLPASRRPMPTIRPTSPCLMVPISSSA